MELDARSKRDSTPQLSRRERPLRFSRRVREARAGSGSAAVQSAANGLEGMPGLLQRLDPKQLLEMAGTVVIAAARLQAAPESALPGRNT